MRVKRGGGEKGRDERVHEMHDLELGEARVEGRRAVGDKR